MLEREIRELPAAFNIEYDRPTAPDGRELSSQIRW